MDWRDRELLEQQLRRINPPPRNTGTLTLAGVALFLAGMTVGSFLFAYKTHPTRTAANEPAHTLSLSRAAPVVRH